MCKSTSAGLAVQVQSFTPGVSLGGLFGSTARRSGGVRSEERSSDTPAVDVVRNVGWSPASSRVLRWLGGGSIEPEPSAAPTVRAGGSLESAAPWGSDGPGVVRRAVAAFRAWFGAGSASTLPGGPGPYLATEAESCDGTPDDSTQYEIRGCGCGCCWCPRCQLRMGLKLRERLREVLATFTRVQMWTLTIDPQQFNGPREMLDWVRDNRCIARFVRGLKAAGHLHSSRYFCVIEFQPSGNPHWHLLVDASFVPFELAAEIWNRFRPCRPGLSAGERCGFGAVWFSKRDTKNPHKAANYACKYVLKGPEGGLPSWLLDARCKVPRYSVSKGFWGKESAKPGPEPGCQIAPVDVHPETCFCGVCRGEIDPETPCDTCPKPQRTIRERLGQCATRAVVVKVVKVPIMGGWEVRREFVGELSVPFSAVRAAFGVAADVCSVPVSATLAGGLLRGGRLSSLVEGGHLPGVQSDVEGQSHDCVASPVLSVSCRCA